MEYSLRPYQEEAESKIDSAFARGKRKILVVAPTGAGKTVLGCHRIETELNHGMRILVIAHRSELISQCSNKLHENGISHGIIKAGMDAGSHHDRVQVASIQTFNSRLRFMRNDYRLIIIDEAHHATANTYGSIIEHCGNPNIIGLTATPYRTDGTGLGNVFDDLIAVTDTATLVNDGYLVPVRIFSCKERLDLSGVKMRGGDYDEKELEKRVRKPRLLGHAVAEYMRLARGKRAVVFTCSVAHSKEVAEAFQAAGIPTEHLDGKTKAHEREAIGQRFKKGITKIVCNCGVWTEGFDEPAIEVVIGLRPTESRCLWRQMIGRGLRLCKEIYKTHCMVLDHCGWTQTHGHITDPDIISLDKGLSKKTLAERERSLNPSQIKYGLGDGRFQLDEHGMFFDQPGIVQPQARLYQPATPNFLRKARR